MLGHVRKKLDLYIKERQIQSNKIRIQLAYSGGMDSACLLNVLNDLKEEYDIDLFITYINYSTSSYSKKVSDYIDNIKIKTSNKNIHLAIINDKNNFESEARSIRYNVLNSFHIEKNIDFTFTAQHFDDQLETIVMKFIDGSDYVSLQGIREKFKSIYRPILEIRKEDIIKYARINNVVYFEDPSNKDISFVRNKVRKFVMPYLIRDSFLINKMKEINLRSINSFKKTKNKINDSIEKIEFDYKYKYLFLKLDDIFKYDLIELKIFLSTILGKFFNLKIDKRKSFWLEVLKFITTSKTGSKFIFFDDIMILKDREGVFIYNDSFLDDVDISRIKIDCNFSWGLGKIACDDKDVIESNIEDEIIIDEIFFSRGVYVRPWKHGDKVSKRNKKISDLLIKMKVPLIFKDKYPVVEDCNGNIVWVPGVFFDKQYKSSKRGGQKIIWMK